MKRDSGRFFAVLLLAQLTLFWGAASAKADDPRETTSLKFAPARAAFYSTSLRHKELLDRMISSKAYQRMVGHKVLSTAIAQGTGYYEAALGQFQEQNPEAWAAVRGFYEQGLKLVGEMLSDECFSYGGKGWTEIAPQVQAISNKVNSLVSSFGELSEEERNAKLLELLDDSELQKLLGKLRTPETVLGFKIQSRQLADDQLTILAFGIKQAIASNPDLAPLQKMYKKETLAGGPFHVFTIDLSLLTPELIEKIASDSDSGEQAAKAIEKLRPALKDFKLVISLGRIDDYLLISLGNDNEHLAKWGEGKLLIDIPEFAPLKKAGDREFTAINFVSKELTAAASNPAALEGQLEQLRQIRDKIAEAGGAGEIPLTEESLKKITDLAMEDLKKLQSLAQQESNPRAALSFTYDAEEGFETLSYEFGPEKMIDGGKELSILSHVGASPICFAAGRIAENDEAAETISYIGKRVLEFADAVEFGDEEEAKQARETFDKAKEKLKPIVEKFVEITTEQILPSLKDGQSAIVFDASLTTNKLSADLPPAEVELPLPEIAIVIGVSDAQKLKEGLKAYLALGRELISAIREVAPESVPEEVMLPDPEVTSEKEGELATYEIPSDEEVVRKFLLPTFGLGEDFAVLALHRTTAQRLLGESELDEVAEGVESALEKPLGGASQFDFDRLMDVVESYVAYAADLKAFDQLAAQAPFSSEELQQQTVLILDFLRCYERTSSVTTIESGATVTKSICVFRDYEEDKDEK